MRLSAIISPENYITSMTVYFCVLHNSLSCILSKYTFSITCLNRANRNQRSTDKSSRDWTEWFHLINEVIPPMLLYPKAMHAAAQWALDSFRPFHSLWPRWASGFPLSPSSALHGALLVQPCFLDGFPALSEQDLRTRGCCRGAWRSVPPQSRRRRGCRKHGEHYFATW